MRGMEETAMLILVSGGSGSGKSAFAEDLITASGLETKI